MSTNIAGKKVIRKKNDSEQKSANEFKWPLKKRPLAGLFFHFFDLIIGLTLYNTCFCFLCKFDVLSSTEAHTATYALDQERCFERMMEALKKSQNQQQASLLDMDPEVEAFVNGIAYSLQKVSGEQRERLFIDIHQLIYDMLFPRRNTLPHPVTHTAQGAEPHLGAFRPPCPVATPSMLTGCGDQNQFGCNWVPTSQMDGERYVEYSHTLQFIEL